ncbi:MAG: helical backbone metal receptor [Syntrophorhabdaceae bacterium]|nr:helical backbone metal receptor [Syntrophorhabdaceae bacterium]
MGFRRTRWFFPPALLLFLLLWPLFSVIAADSFPLEIRDDRGVAVRLSAPPRRVVSLAPSLTEIVFLLGKESALTGVTRFCNYPRAASSLQKVGGMADSDVERIVALSPDIVLCTTDGNSRERVLALERMGIPCFAVAPQNIRAVFETIERLGTLLGDAGRGRAEAAKLARRVEAVRSAVDRNGKAAPRALFVVSTSPIIAAGSGTFMDELLELAGARNAAGAFRSRYPRFSIEELIAAAPDVIFVAAMKGVERFSPEVMGWKEIPAFRDGFVFLVDGDLVTRPGPRLVTALEKVSAVLTELSGRRGGNQ